MHICDRLLLLLLLPVAAARKQASVVARGVGQIVLAGSWHYSLD